MHSMKTGAPRSAAPGAYSDGQRLLWFDEAPPVLQFNKYVLSGYRAGERLDLFIHTPLAVQQICSGREPCW